MISRHGREAASTIAALAAAVAWSGTYTAPHGDRATLHYQTKSGPLHALDNVSLEVRDGEFLCIIGPSGCGKTTLLWSMAGIAAITMCAVLLLPTTGASRASAAAAPPPRSRHAAD